MIENVPNANDKKFVFLEGGIHDRIIKGVLKGLDQNRDWAVNRAIEDFLDAYQSRLAKKEDKEILREITSKEAVEAIIQFHQALFESLVLQIRAENAHQKCRTSANTLRSIVEKGEMADSNVNWEIDPFKGLIVREKKDREQPAFQEIVEYVKAMAEGSSPIPLESICNGILPEKIQKVTKQLCGIKVTEFMIDIARFMVENAEFGRGTVMKICNDGAQAKELAMGNESKGPLKFLATLVWKIPQNRHSE